MRIFANISRGLVAFITTLIVIVALIAGYRFLAGGVSTTPSSAGSSGGFFSALFPFGSGGTQAGNGGSATGTPLTETQSGPVPVLREVSANPVSGAWFTAGNATTSTPFIRFMDRASGHISETPAGSLAVARITNTTLPGVEELYQATPGSAVVRYLSSSETVVNVYGSIYATSSESFEQTPLRAFDRVAVEPGGNMLTVREENGGSTVEFSKPDGTKLEKLLSSPIASWVPLIGGGRTFLETAPSATALGYVYELSGGTLRKISGGIAGMMATVSPSGTYVAVSGNAANGFSLAVVSTKDGSTLGVPVHAMAAKCAWVPGKEPLMFCAVPNKPPAAAYPDDWLLGTVSFSDEGFVVNPTKGTAYFIGDLTDASGTGIDAENVSVDASGSYALFMNKKDLSLWSLQIEDAVARAEGL
jgi:hypothetical protein